ncbi:ATP-binding protein [Shimia sp.]|uniref:hybrid sensor histidine kinase/response regulator n=1 Tax=Shimia sp. TaxID=1954381 RepID=UPI003298517E
MKHTIPRFPLRALHRAGLLAAAISIGVIALTIFVVSGNLRDQINEQTSTKSDSTQWTLAQSEVDLRVFQISVSAAIEGTGSISDVRRRYDILYSRISTLSNGRQFANVRKDPQAQEALNTLSKFIAAFEHVIDGSDASISLALPQMAEELVRIAPEARRFAVAGVRTFAANSDQHRRSVGSLLSQIALLTLILVLIFFVVVYFLLALVRSFAVTEAGAAESRNRLQEVISTSIDGILTIGQDGRIIDYNGAAERIFGFTREEAIGAVMSELIIPDHLRDAHENGMARYRETREHHVVGKGLLRLEAMRKCGQVFPVELTISAARAVGDDVFVSYIRDISERVEVEQELIETRDKAVAGEKAKADLIAVMSHEMRTPLNGLLGTMELLQGTELDAKKKKYLSAMETSANLLLHHVNGVLNMSKADAGRLELNKEPLAPGAFLKELVESQHPAFEANGNRISYNAKHAPKKIWVDKVKLLQVVLNLVANANKFTRNGDISVECDQLSDGQTVEFRITDTGIGIAQEDQEVVFEDFRTLDTSYGRMAEGSGLGLGISRRLVEAMGGRLELESELEVGSIFLFKLPVGMPDVVGVETIEENAGPADVEEALRILLVEDNEINRLVATDMLANAGHDVVVAEDGTQGVSLAEASAFDLIFMDISMPELDGVEATVLIRNGNGPNHDVPIIALTAHALPDDRKRFAAAGISETIVKPLSVKSLNAAIVLALNRTGRPTSDGPEESNDVLGVLFQKVGETKIRALVGEFADEVESMQRAHSDETSKISADQVHRIAGSASVLGCKKLHRLLQVLENDVRSKKSISDKFMAELSSVWDDESKPLFRR